MQLRRAVVGMVALVLLGACKKDEGTKVSEKDAFEKVIGIVKGPVAQISAYLPYLEAKPMGGAYAPKVRPDLFPSVKFAANGIRHAANAARQRLQADSSAAAASLADPFVAVTRACADLLDIEAAPKCRASVDALDDALRVAAEKAAASGATSRLPRVAPESIDDAAKKQREPLDRAMGGGNAELALLGKLEDAAAAPADVLGACQPAEDEGTGNMAAVEKVDEEVRKVAAYRREMVKAVCARLGRADKARADLESCLQEKEKKKVLSKERAEECKLACTAGRSAIDEGIPAATFARLPDLHQKFCDKDAAAKK